MESLKRKKTLQSNFVQSDRFESLSFSSDGKYLAAIGGPPDNLLCVWIWESKSQALARMKLGTSTLAASVAPTPNAQIKPLYSVSIHFLSVTINL